MCKRGILGAALPAFLLIAVASCSTETSIFLTVRSGLKVPSEMDSLRVKIDETGRQLYDHQYSLDTQKALTLEISPGRDEEYQIHITATALKAGSEVAVGEAIAGFKKDRMVEVVIELGPPGSADGGFDGGGTDGGCSDGCGAEGLSECVSKTARRVCADLDDDGCLEWGPEAPCGDNAECVTNTCTCLYGFDDCNDDLNDGCESELAKDTWHCGNCHTSCDPLRMHAAGTFCSYGYCDYEQCMVEYSGGADRSAGCQSWDYYPRTYRGADQSGVGISEAGGGLILAGTTRAYGAGDADLWLLKLAPDGLIEWQHTIGGTGFEAHASAIRTAGGFFMAGYTDTLGSAASGYNAWIASLDSNGDPLWQKMMGGTKADYTDFVAPLGGGEFLVAGRTASFGAGGEDAWLIRIKESGEVVWQRAYGSDGNEEPTAVIETSEGDLIVAGTISPSGTGTKSGLLLKLKGDGGLISAREISGEAAKFFKPVSISASPEGGYIITGVVSLSATAQDIAILHLNKNLDADRQAVIGGAKADVATAAVPVPGGGAVICGYTESEGAGKRDILFVKVGPEGAVEWQRTYGGAEDDAATSVASAQTGYFIGGVTQSFGATGQTADAVVLRIEDDGSMHGGCGADRLRNAALSIGGLDLEMKTITIGSSETTAVPLSAPATIKDTSISPEMRCWE